MNAIMYITTTQAVVVFCLICFAYWMSGLFRQYWRDVHWRRRRGISRPNIRESYPAEERIRAAAERMISLVLSLLLLDIALVLIGLKFRHSTGTFLRFIPPLVFVITPLVILIPICHGIICTFARRAWLANRSLHPATMGVAVVGSLVSVLICLAAALVGVGFAANPSVKLPQFVKDSIGILLLVGTMSYSSYMVLVFPLKAHDRLVSAYRFPWSNRRPTPRPKPRRGIRAFLHEWGW